MNEELNVGVENTEMEDVVDCDTCESSGFWKKVVKTTVITGLGTIVVGGVIKGLGKLAELNEKHVIRKLEKKGYEIYAPIEEDTTDQVSDKDAE